MKPQVLKMDRELPLSVSIIRILSTLSLLGEGGYCGSDESQVYKSYGQYNQPPNLSQIRTFQNQIGSIGMAGDTDTWGGGRLVIIADSIKLEGKNEKIQAHGYP